MDRKLIVFVGGVHGVGKTTVLEALRKKYLGAAIYDPGDLFWNYSINSRILAPSAVEAMVAESLKGTVQPVTFVNWHYAVWTPERYIPHISWNLWREVAKQSDLRFLLINLTAPTDTILHRREKDRHVKKRKLSREALEKEMEQSGMFFMNHVGILEEEHALWHACGVRNDVPEEAAEKILQEIEALSSTRS